MRRTMGLLEKQPGFLVHAVIEESGATPFNIVTMVAWESERALFEAGRKLRGHRDEMGFDLQSTLARWGIRAESRIFIAP